MPQIVSSQIGSINAQRKASDKDNMRWDANKYLQSAIQQKQIATSAKNWNQQGEALIQAGLVSEQTQDKYGNQHRVYTRWDKPEEQPVVEPEVTINRPDMPALPTIQKEGPSGAGKIAENQNYPLGNVGVGTPNHIASSIMGSPYQLSDSDRTQLDGIIPSITPDYFKSGGKIVVNSGHDATKYDPKNLEAIRKAVNNPNLTDEEAQYMLATSRGSDMSRSIHTELMNKGIALPLTAIQVNPYKGDKVKNESQRFSSFGLSGKYNDDTKTFENQSPKIPKGSNAYDDTQATPTMQEWKKTMNSLSAYMKMQDPRYISGRKKVWDKEAEKKGNK